MNKSKTKIKIPDHRKNPAAYVIFKFGGLKQTAKVVNRTVGAVSQWKTRKQVPQKLHVKILQASQKRNLDISWNHLLGI